MASAKTVTEVGFQPPPPTTSKQLIVSFPAEHTVQLTLNRPEAMNAMSPTLQDDLERTLAWFDAEPSLWYVTASSSLNSDTRKNLLLFEDYYTAF
ncbi:ClpP/crotonase [Sanghuangporus baumii]|uniref:ClpP/crotonase n=1 Tax=Sanghuangporus baumii TaxID=108892 RepID=A0A9Q5HW68_SANBA|nr:ClpP/crotonase [Sanghuangporus baumii]